MAYFTVHPLQTPRRGRHSSCVYARSYVPGALIHADIWDLGYSVQICVTHADILAKRDLRTTQSPFGGNAGLETAEGTAERTPRTRISSTRSLGMTLTGDNITPMTRTH